MVLSREMSRSLTKMHQNSTQFQAEALNKVNMPGRQDPRRYSGTATRHSTEVNRKGFQCQNPARSVTWKLLFWTDLLFLLVGCEPLSICATKTRHRSGELKQLPSDILMPLVTFCVNLAGQQPKHTVNLLNKRCKVM